MPSLSSEMKVIAPDMRGFGASPMRGALTFTFEGLCQDLAEILKAQNVKAAHIIGASMGGYGRHGFCPSSS